jgi:hypothetical protein
MYDLIGALGGSIVILISILPILLALYIFNKM